MIDNITSNLNQKILEFTNKGKKPFILDCGCGNCWLSSSLKNASFIVGLDIHSHHHEKGKIFQAFFHKTNAAFVYADATKLPFKEGAFDIVYSNEFISHVSDSEKTLCEQARVLVKKGDLIICDANVLNPFVFFSCFVVNWIRTHRAQPHLRTGGLKWLIHRDEAITEYALRQGRLVTISWKNENIHTVLYWKSKLLRIRGLTLSSACTFWSIKLPAKFNLIGNKIWVEAIKS